MLDGTTLLEEQWGGDADSTNNRMELTAVINGLSRLYALGKHSPATVYTDSQYVQKGMTEWIFKWKKSGWRGSDNIPIKNRDLWEKLDALAVRAPEETGARLEWRWIRGHVGDKWNERCDLLTQKGIFDILNS
jgi:ribonuclease HI